MEEVTIEIHNSENPHCPPILIDGNATHLRIILTKKDGSTQELFRGHKFSEEKWKERMRSEAGGLWSHY